MKLEFKNCDYSYDKSCDAIFIELDEDLVYSHSEEVGPNNIWCVIDVDDKQNPIRLEFLDWSIILNKDIKELDNFKIKKVILEPVIGDTKITLYVDNDIILV